MFSEGILCDLGTHINLNVYSFTADTNYCCYEQSCTNTVLLSALSFYDTVLLSALSFDDTALLSSLSFDEDLPPQNKGSCRAEKADGSYE
jgi:hypothetical protein